jgi:hypothetical protein
MQHSRFLRGLLPGLIAAAGLSCATPGPTPPVAPEAETAAPAPGATGSALPAPWKDLTKQQRGKYMKEVVFPRMKDLFTAFDPDIFAGFSCSTCHGAGAKDHSFTMPNPDIFVLPSTPAEFAPLMQKKPKWVKFMSETVTPQMAALLGMKQYDPADPRPDTFGCLACHTARGR